MKLPQSTRNWISIIGAFIAILNIAFIAFLLIITSFFHVGGAYNGLIIYVALPTFLIAGLLMIPIGMFITNRKIKKFAKTETEKQLPVIDFNKPTTRNALVVFSIGSFMLLLFSSVGSYEAFHYTESVEFCGLLCHRVMEPEYVAYHQSAHARVACVECHVGNGATWYAKSKLSGLYQVYAVLANVYSRPIASPVENLRPARETCEECHWPEKFYDRKIRTKRLFIADDENTEWDIHLQMKTSAKHSADGNSTGIHWHINPDVKIEYIATDKTRTSIPWVKYTNLKTGEITIYQDEETKLSQNQVDSLEVRVMDCLDCHNRPSHNYRAPQHFIDDYLASGAISTDIPEIKYVSMGILAEDYPTKDSAFIAINAKVMEYYQENYPDFAVERKQDLVNAIAAIEDGYSKNIFPEMGVKWSEYPNHLGHMESEGCDRCHNDKHSTPQGRVIPRNCNLCHIITSQGIPGSMEISNETAPLEFKHPVDMGEAWRTEECSSCHSQLF